MSSGSSPWMTTELMKTYSGWPKACWTSWMTKVPGATSVGSWWQVGSDKVMDMVFPLPVRAASWSGRGGRDEVRVRPLLLVWVWLLGQM